MAVKKMSSLPSGMSQSRDKRTYREIIALVLDKDRDRGEHRVLNIQEKGLCSEYG